MSAGERETIATIGGADVQPGERVVVERTEPGAAALARSSGAGGRARVVRETDATVTLDATLRRPGLVVLDDSLEQGWSATVDGRPAQVVRTDDVMRGVAAPAGRHRIVWSYAVPGLAVGFALSLIGLVLLLAACLVRFSQGRRSRQPRTVASAADQ